MDFKKKIYQVFVSSTYRDLQLERNAAMSAIVDMGNVPIGMEHFPAGNEEQFEYIKKLIDSVDYYILIIAGCYGTICPRTGISYTEMEFDYAIKKQIPVAVLVRKDIENLKPTQKETDDIDKQRAIKAFREKVTRDRVCDFWDTQDQLKYVLRKALDNLIETKPRIGFTRDVIVDTTEINNLRTENNDLKRRLKQLHDSMPKIASGEDKYVFEYTDFIAGGETIRESFTWNEIFKAIAPYIVKPMSPSIIGDAISDTLLDGKRISDSQERDVLNQFIALDLISVTNYFIDGEGPDVSCTLSDHGRRIYASFTVKTKPTKTDRPLWEVLMNYRDLSKEEFKSAYDGCIEQLKSGQIEDAALLAIIVSTYAELHDNGIPLSDDNQKLLRSSIYSILYNTGNQDRLHGVYLRYSRSLSMNGFSKVKTPTVVEYCDYFYSTYNTLKQRFKNQMTLILENLTDENVVELRYLLSESPDNGKTYSSMAILKDVDLASVLSGIKRIKEKSRNDFACFIEVRYDLAVQVQLVEEQFKNEEGSLKWLYENLNNYAKSLDVFDQFSYKRLLSALCKSIQRINGDLKRLV